MESKLTLGSLFDGSGGFPLGGMLSGITPVWASEVDPYPIRVTTKRMPEVRHYGDVARIDGGAVEPVDVITFGSPCQDMSVAGKRDGLGGSRSSLFFEAVRIIKEMRCATDGKYPRYAVWENVPGAFSSNRGEDFKAVLESLCEIKAGEVSLPRPEKWPPAGEIVGDGFSLAWRTLDAQYWGVPQRRRRIYLVVDFDGGSAGGILFESEGLSGYSAEGFRAWQAAARGPAARAGEAGGDVHAFHINQREEGIDLHGVSGALMASQNLQMQTFVTSPVPCLNDQGGERMGVSENVAGTLRAETHGHDPCVMDPALFENHSQDTRYTGPLETAPTVSTNYGTGGNSQPFVVEGDTPKTLKIRSGCEGGGKGALIQDDVSATLSCGNDQTLFVPEKKAYGIGSFESKGMLSSNPRAGFYEAKTSKTLDIGGGNPVCHQGGIAVVESYAIQGSMIGRDDKNGPRGSGISKGVSFTLDATDRHAVYTLTTGSFMHTAEELAPTLSARDYKAPTTVAYGIDRSAFNQGKNAKFGFSVEEEKQPTMVAKGPGAVESGYAVRRLTPTECARLQGFPDWWCDGLSTEEPSEEEIAFWEEVFEEYRMAAKPSVKPKTRNQIKKWLADPHSDSAEYRMWGNGVALPCVLFVLSGIAYYAALPEKLPEK